MCFGLKGRGHEDFIMPREWRIGELKGLRDGDHRAKGLRPRWSFQCSLDADRRFPTTLVNLSTT